MYYNAPMRKMRENIFDRGRGPFLSVITMILSLCTFIVALWIVMIVVRVVAGW